MSHFQFGIDAKKKRFFSPQRKIYGAKNKYEFWNEKRF